MQRNVYSLGYKSQRRYGTRDAQTIRNFNLQNTNMSQCNSDALPDHCGCINIVNEIRS